MNGFTSLPRVIRNGDAFVANYPFVEFNVYCTNICVRSYCNSNFLLDLTSQLLAML